MNEKCRNCGKDVSSLARFCTDCGCAIASSGVSDWHPTLGKTVLPPGQRIPTSWAVACFAGFIATAMLGWLFISPYDVVRSIEQAALDGNVAALKATIDFSMLRASVKDQLSFQLSQHSHNEKHDVIKSIDLNKRPNDGFDDDDYINPEAIVSIAQQNKANGLPHELIPLISGFSVRSKVGGLERQVSIRPKYESFSRFTVAIRPKGTDSDVILVFHRLGLTNWRLGEIRLAKLTHSFQRD